MLNLTWKKVRGTQLEKPQSIDETSSKSVVYLRRNIERKTVYEGMDAVKVWEYEEAQLTPGEYIEYRAALAELESPAMQQLKTDNEALSLALADIYERVEEQEEKQENIMAALADIYESVAVESEV
jgi:CII-binding regulator of phage lambda lysogenization HflD